MKYVPIWRPYPVTETSVPHVKIIWIIPKRKVSMLSELLAAKNPEALYLVACCVPGALSHIFLMQPAAGHGRQPCDRSVSSYGSDNAGLFLWTLVCTSLFVPHTSGYVRYHLTGFVQCLNKYIYSCSRSLKVRKEWTLITTYQSTWFHVQGFRFHCCDDPSVKAMPRQLLVIFLLPLVSEVMGSSDMLNESDVYNWKNEMQ